LASTSSGPHSSHWGAFLASVDGDRLVDVHPHPIDPEPSALIGNIVDAHRHRSRIAQPFVRKGWLESGPGPDSQRGSDSYIPVSWSKVLDLLAGELSRVRAEHGNRAIFGGSYGWGSAGRFHHAQSQVHRFLNTIGGYTRSVTNYSNAASEITLPRILGPAGGHQVFRQGMSWRTIAANTDLLVAFGGVRRSNLVVAPGGISEHHIGTDLAGLPAADVEVVSVSPLGDDAAGELGARWMPIVPGTDVAVMLALTWVLVTERLADRSFVDRYVAGAEQVEKYLTGAVDGVAKTPEWAANLSGVPAADIYALARRMASRRTLVTTSWSLQRVQYGEQSLWAGLTLAAYLGQIGLPGRGFGHGYGSIGDAGRPLSGPLPTLRQGRNAVSDFIPCARIADMLLHPGEPYDFNGQRLSYPDARLVYWVGGNPFHHHQDLSRLTRALSRPDTIVVHEPFWTGMAKHADFVLPATLTIERDDMGAGRGDPYLIAMRRAVPPVGQARDDYDIFSDLAERMGVCVEFTERRDSRAWLRELYGNWRESSLRRGHELPHFDEFWAAGQVQLPGLREPEPPLADFVADPAKHPLGTPTGRIELYSETVAGFGYPDCPGHAVWLEPEEWLGSALAERFPLHLIANQPARKLHSQLDMGAHSMAGKIHGRERVRMHPSDASARGLSDGEVVRLFNDRGSCLAAVESTVDVRSGVVQLSTGAWFDPSRPDIATCIHGNPNVLTTDRGTSALAQGCTGQHALVEIERYDGELPPVVAFDPPTTVDHP
jgi:biotin/methionine sulfoxide reductase